jgi:ankyrin repeat protein
VEDVRARLQEGADPDAGRFAPLTLAASMGHLAICEQLLEFGADVNGGCRYSTPLVAAVGHPRIEALLRERGARETVFNAVAEGSVAKTRKFLDAEPSLVHVRDETDMTPLFLAASLRAVGLMTLLLDAGADVNVVADGSYGISPIHQASRGGPRPHARAAITLLHSRGADLDARNKGGVAPLHMAVRDRDFQAVRALLEHGAEVDIEDRGRKSTPLRRAVANTGRPGTAGTQDVATEITSLLLKHGANPNHVNRSGKTVLESTRHRETRELLEAAIRRT